MVINITPPWTWTGRAWKVFGLLMTILLLIVLSLLAWHYNWYGKLTAKSQTQVILEDVQSRLQKLDTSEANHASKDALAQETTDRKTEDTKLHTEVGDEKTARTTEDTKLHTAVTDEATARQTEDGKLHTAVTDEATARVNNDKALQDQLNALRSRDSVSHSDLADALNALPKPATQPTTAEPQLVEMPVKYGPHGELFQYVEGLPEPYELEPNSKVFYQKVDDPGSPIVTGTIGGKPFDIRVFDGRKMDSGNLKVSENGVDVPILVPSQEPVGYINGYFTSTRKGGISLPRNLNPIKCAFTDHRVPLVNGKPDFTDCAPTQDQPAKPQPPTPPATMPTANAAPAPNTPPAPQGQADAGVNTGSFKRYAFSNEQFGTLEGKAVCFVYFSRLVDSSTNKMKPELIVIPKDGGWLESAPNQNDSRFQDIRFKDIGGGVISLTKVDELTFSSGRVPDLDAAMLSYQEAERRDQESAAPRRGWQRR